MPVLLAGVAVFLPLAYSPAVLAVVTFGPPAIQNRAVGDTVQRGLHAACAACFVWPAGCIEPDINAMHKIAGHIDIILFQEDNLSLEARMVSRPVDLLYKLLARLVLRVRLPRENDLHRALRIVDDSAQSVGVGKEQGGPLVSC